MTGNASAPRDANHLRWADLRPAQQWIIVAACVGTIWLGWHALDAIDSKVAFICNDCEGAVAVETGLLALFVLLAAIGVYAVLAWFFVAHNTSANTHR